MASTLIVVYSCIIMSTLIFMGLIADKHYQSVEPATIGGTEVPNVQCAEDEVIAFTGIDQLSCVHIEQVQP